MRYQPLNTITEGHASRVLLSGNRTAIARMLMRRTRPDRIELIKRLYWVGYPVK